MNTADIPKTISKNFIYANDIRQIAEDKVFKEVEKVLNTDLVNLKRHLDK